MAHDTNPRPHKRQRLQSASQIALLSPVSSSQPLSSPLTSLPPSSPIRDASNASRLLASHPQQQPHPPLGSKVAGNCKQLEQTTAELNRLPAPALLLSLPKLLAVPPNHPLHARSLHLSLVSFRKCLMVPGLNPEEECRAWTGLVEVGMSIIEGGWPEKEEEDWAHGVEAEVDKAISKGLMLSQKHPSLQVYRSLLSIHQATLAHWQRKQKFSRNVMKRLLSSFSSSSTYPNPHGVVVADASWSLRDPPHIVYTAYLTAIEHLVSTITDTSSSASSPQLSPRKQERLEPFSPAKFRPTGSSRRMDLNVQTALDYLEKMNGMAQQAGHDRIKQLVAVLKLRTLLSAGLYDLLAGPNGVLADAERAFAISYNVSEEKKSRADPVKADASFTSDNLPEMQTFADATETALALHVLIMGVVYYTQVGEAAQASPRSKHLHALMDAGALEGFKDSSITIPLDPCPPLSLRLTHPRILWHLVYLLGATSKRDTVGRKPRRKVWAEQGLAQFDKADKETGAPPALFPTWASAGDVSELEQRLARIKADLMCELVTVSIMRSEWDKAKQTLDSLIAHARTSLIWDSYSCRIALHYAHLAHALGRSSRARELYKVAAFISDENVREYGGRGEGLVVRAAAKAGHVLLAIGRRCERSSRGDEGARVAVGKASESEDEDEDEGFDPKEVITECRAAGGMLDAIAHIVEAGVATEIISAKQHLKRSLDVAAAAQDNYLRALVLALIVAHYTHTAEEHAWQMLNTCEMLAAGLGAPPKASSSTEGGNVVLGLWIAERMLEILRRNEEGQGVAKLVAKQEMLRHGLKRLIQHGNSMAM